ncbi:MAG: hypothetical protein WAZ77_12265 [Candidatus Nitrosopolaris sp.]
MTNMTSMIKIDAISRVITRVDVIKVLLDTGKLSYFRTIIN